MASRIVVIEEPCPNCRQAGLYCELCNGYGVLSRRVLDPGSFVLIEKVNGEWPEVAIEHVRLWIHPLANDPEGFLDDFVDALAGAES